MATLPNLKPLQGAVSQVVQGMQNLVELKTLVTDVDRSSKNEAIMAKLKLPYYIPSRNGQEEGLVKIPDENDVICGYMMGGFGWSIENSYEDLLPMTSEQKAINQFTRGASLLSSILPSSMVPNNSFLTSGTNKTLMSLQQTMSIWQGMKKPNFSLRLLFFDAEGSESSKVTRVAYITERALYPYVNQSLQLGSYNVNLTMQAPGGYRPLLRAGNTRGQTNRSYSMSAEGLGEVQIGTFMYFPEVICTGANMQYSDKMLNNGQPQWLEVTYNFTMWRQPVLEDLDIRYTGSMGV